MIATVTPIAIPSSIAEAVIKHRVAEADEDGMRAEELSTTCYSI
nr:hypothetical protein [Bradyrhizobium uaiense]